jgi:hypothetical protein
MPSLIEDVLRIEQAADSALAQARASVRAIEARADRDIAAVRREVTENLDARIVSFRAEAETRHRRAVEQAERESAAALADIAHLDENALDRLADRIADHFCGK